MRQLITISILFIFSISSFGQTLNFDFFNSNGKQYNTKTLNEQLENEYNAEFDEKIILLETPSLTDSLYVSQNRILDLLKAESLELIYITACLTKEHKGGYHTTIEKAKELVGENPRFRIRLLGLGANILFESNEVISKNEIEELLNN